MKELGAGSPQYEVLAHKVMTLSRPALRNYGLKLHVNIPEGSPEIEALLQDSPFHIDNSRKLTFSLSIENVDSEYLIKFSSTDPSIAGYQARAHTLQEAINKISDEVFSEKI